MYKKIRLTLTVLTLLVSPNCFSAQIVIPENFFPINIYHMVKKNVDNKFHDENTQIRTGKQLIDFLEENPDTAQFLLFTIQCWRANTGRFFPVAYIVNSKSRIFFNKENFFARVLEIKNALQDSSINSDTRNTLEDEAGILNAIINDYRKLGMVRRVYQDLRYSISQ